jgi:hypothetical protein
MGTKIFTTKKMKLEKKAWLQKSIIVSAVIAILGGACFGGYTFLKDDVQSNDRPSSKRYAERATPSFSSRSLLPAFATSNSENHGKPSTKQAGHGSKKHGSSKKSDFASHKKHKGKKTASMHGKKHKSKKIASGKKHKKNKLAAHKKHHKKHLAHGKKHKTDKQLAQK